MEEITRSNTIIAALVENKHTIIRVGLGQKDINMPATIFHLGNMPLNVKNTWNSYPNFTRNKFRCSFYNLNELLINTSSDGLRACSHLQTFQDRITISSWEGFLFLQFALHTCAQRVKGLSNHYILKSKLFALGPSPPYSWWIAWHFMYHTLLFTRKRHLFPVMV